jgi:GNAT superfamily N-acetyltransferase
MLTGYRLAVDTAPAEADIRRLQQHLRAFNVSRAGDGGHLPLLISLLDDGPSLAGGLFGKIAYQWLFVDLLWVAEEVRGLGQGSKLLAAAEEEARRHGCHNAWLDTFTFQARSFYEKNGYAVFGQLPDYPPGHTRYFLHKRL